MLKGWFISMVCVAMLVAVADALLVGSKQRQIGKIAAAMLILLVVFRPILGLKGIGTGVLTDDLLDSLQLREDQLQAGTDEVLKAIVEERTQAYVQEKLIEMSVAADLSVECVQGQDGLWLPDSISIKGSLTEWDQRELEKQLQSELGLSRDRIVFEKE